MVGFHGPVLALFSGRARTGYFANSSKVESHIWEFALGFQVSMYVHMVRPSDSIRRLSGVDEFKSSAQQGPDHHLADALPPVEQVEGANVCTAWPAEKRANPEASSHVFSVWLTSHDAKDRSRAPRIPTIISWSRVALAIRWFSFWEP